MLKQSICVVDKSSDSGFKNIHRSRFDPAKHEVYVEPANPVVQESVEVTHETVKTMKKADVIELLEAHGIEADRSTPVGDLREQLAGIVFIGDVQPAAAQGGDSLFD